MQSLLRPIKRRKSYRRLSVKTGLLKRPGLSRRPRLQPTESRIRLKSWRIRKLLGHGLNFVRKLHDLLSSSLSRHLKAQWGRLIRIDWLENILPRWWNYIERERNSKTLRQGPGAVGS